MSWRTLNILTNENALWARINKDKQRGPIRSTCLCFVPPPVFPVQILEILVEILGEVLIEIPVTTPLQIGLLIEILPMILLEILVEIPPEIL